MFPWACDKLIEPIFSADALTLVALTVVDHILSQRLSVLPKLYVLLTSGIISLAISALSVMLSVSASPNVMLPLAVILPVACKLPVTLGGGITIEKGQP